MGKLSVDQSMAREIGQLIAGVRRHKNISQKDFSRYLGVTPQSLSQIENGHVNITAQRLVEAARILGCHPAQLLPGENGVELMPKHEGFLATIADLQKLSDTLTPLIGKAIVNIAPVGAKAPKPEAAPDAPVDEQ